VLVLSQLTRAPERDERGPQLSICAIRSHRTGCGRGDVHYRPHFFKAGATPEEREETSFDRQAAQRPDRHGEVRISQPVHSLRRSRAGRLLAIQSDNM